MMRVISRANLCGWLYAAEAVLGLHHTSASAARGQPRLADRSKRCDGHRVRFSGWTRPTLLLIRPDRSGSPDLNSHSRRTPERPLRLPAIGFPRPTIGAFERAVGPCPTRNGVASFPAAAGHLDVRPRAPSLPGRFPRFSRAQTKTTWASRSL